MNTAPRKIPARLALFTACPLLCGAFTAETGRAFLWARDHDWQTFVPIITTFVSIGPSDDPLHNIRAPKAGGIAFSWPLIGCTSGMPGSIPPGIARRNTLRLALYNSTPVSQSLLPYML